MRIAVLGTGGVGGYFGGVLALAGHEVTALARGANLDALRSRGLELRTPEGTRTAALGATDDSASLGDADLALVAVKSYTLGEIAPVAARLAQRGAVVLPLLNGVDVADRLAAGGVPRRALLGGLTFISAARVAPGVVERFSPFQRVVVGELPVSTTANAGDATQTSDAQRSDGERAERIARAFRDAGVDARASDAIGVELWRKFVFLAPLAAACGLARKPVGPVRDAPLGPQLIERLVAEAVAVGVASGVALADDEVARTVASIAALPAEMRPSFLLDLERGGPTELDALSGAVARLGRERRVATPLHDAVVAATSAALA